MAEMRTFSPTVVAVLASAAACDRVAGLAGACRVAPDEVAIVGDVSVSAVLRTVRAADPDALVVDVSDGWIAHTLEGGGARDAFARLSELELPPSGFVQGEVASIGARVVVDGDRIEILVPAPVSDHTRERISRDCAGLLG